MSKVLQQAHYLLLWFLGVTISIWSKIALAKPVFSHLKWHIIFTANFHSTAPRSFHLGIPGTATSTAAQDPHSSAETQRPSPKRSTTWHGLSQLRRFHEAKFPPFDSLFVSKLPRHSWMAKWIELLFYTKSYNSSLPSKNLSRVTIPTSWRCIQHFSSASLCAHRSLEIASSKLHSAGGSFTRPTWVQCFAHSSVSAFNDFTSQAPCPHLFICKKLYNFTLHRLHTTQDILK